ncbi:MAG: hypothetical protein NDJ89_10165 [Oligoflexia bacterium]|nr:hypothetical protein [Oligoflexia bacterium]
MISRYFGLGIAILSLLCSAPEGHALLTTRTTLSTGFYRDVEQRGRVPALFYWTLNHTSPDRIETNVDLGVNNDVHPQGAWRVYLYEARVDVPFGKSRLSLGRQLLTEGFELSTFDGVMIPLRIASWLELLPLAGISSTVDNLEPEERSRSAGLTAFGSAGSLSWKAGYLRKSKPGISGEDLAHVSALHDFSDMPLTPALLGKAQWDLTRASFDQGLAELQLTPHRDLQLALTYSDRKPSVADTASRDWIYRLFSISSRKEYGASAAWRLTSALTALVTVQDYRFDSVVKRESANEQQISLLYRRGNSSLEPFFARISSHGGEVFQTGLRAYAPISDRFDARGLVDLTKIEKLNGISGWAHHLRAGMGYQLSSRFLAQAVAELERNHRFELEARAIAYVSHFYY